MSLRVIFKQVNNVYPDYMTKAFAGKNFTLITQGTASSRNNFTRQRVPFGKTITGQKSLSYNDHYV